MASFFSIHRPMSIMYTVPPTSNTESFNALFAPLKKSSRTDEVIYTLSSAVDSMEGAAAQQQQEDEANGEGSLMHLDAEGNELDGVSLMDLNTEEFAGRLRPFHPPPPPVPFHERAKKVRHLYRWCLWFPKHF